MNTRISVPLSMLLFALLGGSARAGGGWQYGDQFWMDARSACKAAIAGDNAVITKLEYSKSGDSVYCWHKAADAEGDATVYTLVHWNVVPWNGKLASIYRGTTPELRRTPADGDFGPGTYWFPEEWNARSEAQARFLDAAGDRPFAEWRSLDPAIVIQSTWPSAVDDRTLDFGSGRPRDQFEAYVRRTLVATRAQRIFDGIASPDVMRDTVTAWVRETYNRALDSYDIVVGPTYRYPGSVQIRVKPGSAYAKSFDQQAKVHDANVREPSLDEIRGALVNAWTSAARGACGSFWTLEGTKLFARRGWRAAAYQALPKGGGNHKFLMIGDVYIDGAYFQFFNHRVSADPQTPGELFVGQRPALIAMLAAGCAEEGNCDPGDTAETLVAQWWTGVPMARGLPSTLAWRGATATYALESDVPQ